MKSKPLIFNVYAMLFLLIALSIPAQISLIYGHGFGEVFAIVNKMTFFNILVIGVCAYNFYYCLNASDNIKWSLPLSIGVVCFNNSLVLIYGNDFEIYTVILSTFVFMAASAYFLVAQDTDIINHPQNHWWRIPQRHLVKQRVAVKLKNNITNFTKTHDISSHGAFIECSEEDSQQIYDEGQIVEISIGVYAPIKCYAKVIRIERAKGSYPCGVGVRFEHMSFIDKLKLKRKVYKAMRLS